MSDKRFRCIASLSILLTSMFAVTPPASAQQQPAGGRSGGVPDTITVALPDNGVVHFNPNGSFAITGLGFVGTGSTGAGASTISTPSTGNPAVSIDRSLADFASEEKVLLLAKAHSLSHQLIPDTFALIFRIKNKPAQMSTF